MTTRTLLEPVRVLLRERDSATGSYPTISRTGDQNRSGRFPVRFDDTQAVVYYTQTQSSAQSFREINYPEGLNVSSVHVTRRVGYTGSIQAPGVQRPGIGDHLVKLSASQENIGPFIEDMMPEQGSYSSTSKVNFFMTGTRDTELPGFSSPLKSKTAIRIDMHNSSAHIFTRNPASHDTLDPDGEFFGTRYSGFAYYNFDLSRWEDIGLKDPATGEDIPFRWSVEATDPADEFDINSIIVSGTETWCQQFTGPDMSGVQTNALRRSLTNLQMVGRPTATMQAPFANRYHATSSQTIKMSDYIRHPFLVEKMVVTFGSDTSPAQAIRTQNWIHTSDASTRQSAERNQDDYVFFVYRQRNTANNIDSAADVSGSERFLMISGSMCFYNSSLKQTNSATPQADSFAPLNNPGFSYDFGLTDTPAYQRGIFTGPISLEMQAMTLGPSLSGYFMVTASVNTTASLDSTRNTPIYNYWPGGTNSRAFLPSDFTGKEQDAGVDVTFGGSYTYNQYDPSSVIVTSRNMETTELDSRAHAMLGKGGAGASYAQPPKMAVSPYLLLPSDKLVFGIDSVLGMRANQISNELTGSRLIFPAGMPSSIVMYGSLVKDKKEFHDTLNQNLTSEAVHEDLHWDNAVVDQFSVEPPEAYIGSYTDEIATGSIFGTSYDADGNLIARGIVGSVGAGTAGTTGSTGPFASYTSYSEMFFDSIPPRMGEFILRAGGTKLIQTASVPGSYFGGNTYVFLPSDMLGTVTRKFRESNSSADQFRAPFPYVGNPDRVNGDNAKLLIHASNGTVWVFRNTIQGNILRDVLFRIGHRRVVQNTFDMHHSPKTGSQGFRYGMLSNEPVYAKAVWRFDRFGQLRDMIEQRPFSVFYNSTTENKQRGKSQEIGKQAGPVQIRFVSSSQVIPANSASYSSNLSLESTSSIPYFDNLATN